MSETYTAGLSDEETARLIMRLAEWGLIYDSVLVWFSQVEFDTREIDSLMDTPSAGRRREKHKFALPEGHKVSAIAFMNPELIGALGSDPRRAKRFLGLLFDYVLPRDSNWKETVTVECSCGSPHTLLPCEWLALLKTKKWVPVRKGDEESEDYEPQAASAQNLEELLGDGLNEIIREDDNIQLLKHLGFNTLELQIRRRSEGDKTREESIRDQLATIVAQASEEDLGILETIVGSEHELSTIVDIANERLKTRIVVRRNKEFGEAIQAIVEQIFHNLAFDIVPVYKGYDFDAYYKGDVEPDDLGSIELEAHDLLYLVEVKATRENEVRMTEAQAAIAVSNSDRYVLCVVDLGGKDLDQFGNQEEFKGAIKDSIFIIEGIGTKLEPVVATQQVSSAKEIEVEFVGRVRYLIRHSLWAREGNSLTVWIRERFHTD